MVTTNQLIEIILALVPAVVFAYKFWRGTAKIKDLKDACKAAINANKEMAPLVKDERLRVALETKISVLELIVDLIDGNVITDNFVWEVDDKIKTLALKGR